MSNLSNSNNETSLNINSKGNVWALFPILVFVVLYLGLGISFEYILEIPMGFYMIPVVVAFMVAIFVACCQHRNLSIDTKIEYMARGLADKNILMMIFIFLLAGLFVGVVGRTSAESVAYFMLSWVPIDYSIVVLFLVSCFVSISMGTSVGTITLITPIAIQVSNVTGFSLPLCVGTVISGAMFGDNLSFISDTTVAACNGQGCPMNSKFKVNFFIALPAAILSLATILVISFNSEVNGEIIKDYNLMLIIPYVLVLVGGVLGVNVFIVLIIGIISGIIFTLGFDHCSFVDLVKKINIGTTGMFETCMVAVLVASLCSLIKATNGFVALLNFIHTIFKGQRMGQIGIGLLVGFMDIATANNTVAIVMSNPIAQQMAKEYGISPRKTASLLDIFSCIMQGVIPYGAQMLVAISIVYSFEKSINAFEIMVNMYYVAFLLVSVLMFIVLGRNSKDFVASQK